MKGHGPLFSSRRLLRRGGLGLLVGALAVPLSLGATTEQPWPWTGWDKFPSLYFAAEAEGDLSEDQLEKIRRFSLAIIEFRAGQFIGEESGSGMWADGMAEAFSERQCQLLQASGDAPPCLVYRSGQWAGSQYVEQLKLLRKQNLFLPDTRDCVGFTDYPQDIVNEPPVDIGLDRCRYDFKKSKTGRLYWKRILREVATEEGVTGVFVDNGQSVSCDEAQHLSTMSRTERATHARKQAKAYKKAFKRLDRAGKYSILSTTNSFSDIGPVLPFENDCALPEENLIQTLGNVPFARNNEFWMWNLGETCSNQIRNTIRETEMEIPVIFHTPYFPSGNGCLEGCIASDGSVVDYTEQEFLEFSMAAFLVAMGQGSYLGFSDMSDPEGGGWFDVSWPYYDLYDNLVTGPPAGPPTVSADGMRFSREFANGSVTVDCSDGTYQLGF